MKNFSFKTRKNYLHSSSKHSVRTVLVLTLVAICVVLLLRGIIGALFSSTVASVLSMRTYFETSSATLPVYLRDRTTLLREIQSLKETLGAQSGMSATIERLTRENTELRALIGDHTEERIGAGVIARPPSVPYDVLIIDHGSDAGIKEGAFVYLSSQFVVGFIQAVYEKTSVVALFSQPQVETTVYIYGPNIFATAYGEGGGIMHISIPPGITVSEGNVVVLPMLDAGMLGAVNKVTSVPTQPEQHAYVSFPQSLQSIHFVSVAREPLPNVSFGEATRNIEAYRTRFMLEVPTTTPNAATSSATHVGTTTAQ